MLLCKTPGTMKLVVKQGCQASTNVEILWMECLRRMICSGKCAHVLPSVTWRTAIQNLSG